MCIKLCMFCGLLLESNTPNQKPSQVNVPTFKMRNVSEHLSDVRTMNEGCPQCNSAVHLKDFTEVNPNYPKSYIYAKILWDKFGDIPVDEHDEIEEPFLDFEKGSDKHAVWHWFEEYFNLSVATDLMFSNNLKPYKYSCSTNTIWTSFDYGEVNAKDNAHALELAKKELQENLKKVNEALKPLGETIEMDFDSITIEQS